MPKVYALLVGIDAYQKPVPALQGSVNDIALAERMLRDRIAPGDLDLRTLIDEQATRAEIIRSFRVHLGRAEAGEIALFWFSGHGSTGDLPDDLWYSDSAGRCQTTVCYDSRHGGVPDIYDKEFAVLVHEVVTTGARLVSIKDSCHARSGMREPYLPRFAEPSPVPPAVRDLLPELRDAVGRPPHRHIALSACEEHQVARERSFRGTVHGVFTEAVCRAVTRLGARATYRKVLSEARCLVEGRYWQQVPSLEAADDDIDDIFLGSALRSVDARITLRHIRDEWEVDVGALHGVQGPGTRFARHGEQPLQEVRVTEVRPDRSVVVPVDWTPDERDQFDMVLTRVPLPPVGVVLDEPVPGLAAALAGSPHVRVIPPPGDTGQDQLLLRVRGNARALEIASADHRPLASPADIPEAVTDLEHMARWLQIRNLANPRSALQDAVVVEVVPARPGEWIAPRDRPALPAGDIGLEYTEVDGVRKPPSAFIRLRNTTDRRLYCVLLDLTDRFRMHAALFPGEHIAAGWTTAAANGAPITFTLPSGREKQSGAYGIDWLMLLVAEERFSSVPFALPRLGETQPGTSRSDRAGLTGILDELGWRAVHRSGDVQPTAAVDWATTVVEVRTTVR